MTKLDLGSPRKYHRRYGTQGTFHPSRAYFQLRALLVRQHQLLVRQHQLILLFAMRYLLKRRRNRRIQEEEERYNDDVVLLLCDYDDDGDKAEERNVDTS